MKLKDILKKVGGAVVREAIPGGGLLLDALGVTDKNATGEQVAAQLPPEALEREYDVQLAELDTLRTMLTSDAASPHTTRPAIAKAHSTVVAFTVVVLVSVLAYAVIDGDKGMIAELKGAWPLVLAILGPSVGLLRAYFGVLERERRDKLHAANGGRPIGGLAALIASKLAR